MPETVTPAAEVAVDPFKGDSPTFEEFSTWRKDGTLPERIKTDAEPEAKPVEAPAAKAETVDGQEPPKEAEQDKPERDEHGKFKAKEADPLFTADQQKAFDKAFSKREAKIRRQLETEYAAKYSSKTQEKQPEQIADPAAPPTRPEPPQSNGYVGTSEEFDKEIAEYPAKLIAFLDAEREFKQREESMVQKVRQSEAKALKAHPDYKEEFARLTADIRNGDEVPLPDHVWKGISAESEDPHELTYYLATNREEFARFASLRPAQVLREVVKLDAKLSMTPQTPPAPEKKPAAALPAPPSPVGGRATASAFDVNDEKMPADEWAKRRNEHLAKAGRR